MVHVEVGTNHNMLNALIPHRPADELQAKFSMEFCMAVLLLDGKKGLSQFTDETVERPDIKQLIERVEFSVHPEAETAGYEKMTTIITVHLKNGSLLTGQADFGKGSPANPLSYDEVADKFLDCAAFAQWPENKSEQLISSVAELESHNLDDLVNCLVVT